MDTKSFLDSYVTERLPQQRPDLFDGAPDEPHFAVDQRNIPLNTQPAMG